MSDVRGKLRISRFHSDAAIASLSAFCPACDFEHGFNVDLEGHGRWANSPLWTFDGDYENPTFSRSMLANKRGVYYYKPICHSFLRNGKWQYLSDSTHDMAGQTVDVPYPDPDMSFERRHGWHLNPEYEERSDA